MITVVWYISSTVIYGCPDRLWYVFSIGRVVTDEPVGVLGYDTNYILLKYIFKIICILRKL